MKFQNPSLNGFKDVGDIKVVMVHHGRMNGRRDGLKSHKQYCFFIFFKVRVHYLKVCRVVSSVYSEQNFLQI